MPVELLPETPSQTAGPYVHIGLAPAAAGNPTREQEIWNEMARTDAPGEHILLLGSVYDGSGHLVRDSFLEFWQADSSGRYQPRFDPSSRSTASAVPPPPSMPASGPFVRSSRVW